MDLPHEHILSGLPRSLPPWKRHQAHSILSQRHGGVGEFLSGAPDQVYWLLGTRGLPVTQSPRNIHPQRWCFCVWVSRASPSARFAKGIVSMASLLYAVEPSNLTFWECELLATILISFGADM